MSTIYGNMVGGASMAQTYILQDPNGEEVVAVLAEEQVVLDATSNDIREGKVAATETGVTTGEKVIPAFHTTQGVVLVPIGKEFKITTLKDLNKYDYTNFGAMVCDFNTKASDSVSTNKVVINDEVYNTQSTESLSGLMKNHSDKSIYFGISNETDKIQIIRYFTYKEIE